MLLLLISWPVLLTSSLIINAATSTGTWWPHSSCSKLVTWDVDTHAASSAWTASPEQTRGWLLFLFTTTTSHNELSLVVLIALVDLMMVLQSSPSLATLPHYMSWHLVVIWIVSLWSRRGSWWHFSTALLALLWVKVLELGAHETATCTSAGNRVLLIVLMLLSLPWGSSSRWLCGYGSCIWLRLDLSTSIVLREEFTCRTALSSPSVDLVVVVRTSLDLLDWWHLILSLATCNSASLNLLLLILVTSVIKTSVNQRSRATLSAHHAVNWCTMLSGLSANCVDNATTTCCSTLSELRVVSWM